jgi:hypothetical protein
MDVVASAKRLVPLVFLLSLSRVGRATEGGSSVYLQGTYNDFGVAMPGPPGLYARNDVFFYTAGVGQRSLGGRADVGIDQISWFYAMKLSLVIDEKIFGAVPTVGVILPVNLHTNATGSVATAEQEGFRRGYVGGLGDIIVTPFQLTWVFGDHNLMAAPSLFVPTGAYSTDRLLNVGRNYFAFDLAASYTWLSSEHAQEFSVTAGYLINLKNQATDYRTGSELHVDWLIAQRFTGGYGIGVTGYLYAQVTEDDGALPGNIRPSDFKANGTGLGPAAMITPRPFGKDVTIMAKWIHDLSANYRFKGDVVMASFALKLL